MNEIERETECINPPAGEKGKEICGRDATENIRTHLISFFYSPPANRFAFKSEKRAKEILCIISLLKLNSA